MQTMTQILMVMFCFINVAFCNVSGASQGYELINIKKLTDDGGRVDWSPDGQSIVFDRKGKDGLYDIWLMKPDGTSQANLTEGHPELPKNVQIGQPAWHPSGNWIVFQVEKPNHKNPFNHHHPGAGVYHDLWVMNMSSRSCYQLTDVRDGKWKKTGGSLHPVFSNNGKRLFWTDLETLKAGIDVVGDWQLIIADFEASPHPKLSNHNTYNPGKSEHWYESHGWGPDDSWVYFAGNTAGTWFLFSDINKMNLVDAPTVFTRLTKSAGNTLEEAGYYDEHAHFTKNYDAFIWLNNESGNSEYWMANPDGSDRRQITHFNTPGYKEYDLVRGLKSVPSDNAWNPSPPKGRQQLVAYVQVNFNLFKNTSANNEIYLLEKRK